MYVYIVLITYMTIDHISFKCRLNHEARLKKKKNPKGFWVFKDFPMTFCVEKNRTPQRKLLLKITYFYDILILKGEWKISLAQIIEP